jgi:ABC-type sugar transport system permease subunit
MRKDWLGYTLIDPWLIGFLFFTGGPFMLSINFSFRRYGLVSPPL